MADFRRQTAYKLSAKRILESEYTQMQGWVPNYLQVGDLKVSRVNLIGVLINKENSLLIVDDGTGQIQLRPFQETIDFDTLSIGDVLLIIGRPREYSKEKYIVPEIIKKLDNKKWLEFRKKELEHQVIKPVEKQEYIEEQPSQSTNNLSIVIEKIRELDEGEGVDTQTLINALQMETPEKHIETLLNEGEIFEIKPGKLKILD